MDLVGGQAQVHKTLATAVADPLEADPTADPMAIREGRRSTCWRCPSSATSVGGGTTSLQQWRRRQGQAPMETLVRISDLDLVSDLDLDVARSAAWSLWTQLRRAPQARRTCPCTRWTLSRSRTTRYLGELSGIYKILCLGIRP